MKLQSILAFSLTLALPAALQAQVDDMEINYRIDPTGIALKVDGGYSNGSFAILISHTLLAAAVPFLVAITLVRALRERFDKHKKIARWTLPIWLYVSVTGVIVYLMLYEMDWS